jgi:RimJ/RimL family protein N-acetyltransferase
LKTLSGTHETEDGQRIAQWFGDIVGKQPNGHYSAMGWLKPDGTLSAAVVFHDWNGANIEMHMVGSISRQGLREAFRYAFLQLKVQRVTAKPYRSNDTTCGLVERLGFVREGVMERYYGPNDDALVFRLDPAAAQKWMT